MNKWAKLLTIAALHLALALTASAQASKDAPIEYKGNVLGAPLDESAILQVPGALSCDTRDPEIHGTRCIRKVHALADFWLAGGPARLVYRDHKLSTVEIKFGLEDGDFSSQVAWLTVKFGVPTTTNTTVYSNAAGAHWNCGSASWERSNGDIIVTETIEVPNRVVDVLFITKDEIARLKAIEAAKPSPY